MLSIVRAFRQGQLSEGDRFVEMICGVIMVLVMIGYLRLTLIGDDDPDFQKKMILIPLGCITAWGIIDGIMYVLLNLVQRGKRFKLFSTIKSAKDQKDAHTTIEDDLASSIVGALKKEDRQKIYDEILKGADGALIEKPQWVTKKDLVIIFFTFLIVFSTGAVILIPLVVLNNVFLAIHTANAIGVVMLFCIGYFWGKHASRNKIRSAIGMVLLGTAIVLVTIALNG